MKPPRGDAPDGDAELRLTPTPLKELVEQTASEEGLPSSEPPPPPPTPSAPPEPFSPQAHRTRDPLASGLPPDDRDSPNILHSPLDLDAPEAFAPRVHRTRDPLASGLPPDDRGSPDPSFRAPSSRPGRDPLASGLPPEERPGLTIPRRWRRALVWGAWSALALFVAGVVGLCAVFWHFSRDLPSVAELESGYKPPQVTRILARDGTLLANLFTERRTVVPFDRVPGHVKHAFLAAEDAHFYQHEGLNYWGMLRALIVNLRSGRVSQGGSTITQQVVKNVLLDNERSYQRKIRETLLAHRLERYLSKDQILGLYLNHIYLGHGRWGVEEAASYYFGKHVQELDIAEAALLAGIVASPERFTPRRSEEKALERRRYVLGQMRDKGFMTEAVYRAIAEEALRLAPAVEAESDLAPEIVPHVRKLLAEVAGEDARRGGFTVHTTIDPHLQAAARKALRDNLDNYLRRQKLAPPFTLEKRRLWGEVFTGMPRQHAIYTGRVVALDDERHTIDVQVGEVRGRVDLRREERYNPKHLKPSEFTVVGAALRVRLLEAPDPEGTDGQDPASQGPDGKDPVQLRLELGPQAALIAIDVRTREVVAAVGSYEALMGGLDRSVQARRQPGSSFKPFVYSYALYTRRVTPATLFKFESTQGAEQRGADAANPSGDAQTTVEALTLRQGVAKSDNRVAEQVLAEVGAAGVVDFAHALGIESKLGATPSLALGAYEVTPLEIANAYASLSAGGLVATPRFVAKVIGPAGELTLPAPPPERRVVDPEVAYLMTSLLESVVREGTAARAKSLGFPVAGKTGTTNQAKDAWFVGYSTQYAVASWVGYDDAVPLGWGEAGAVTALPAWIDWMKAAHLGKPATEFHRPAGVVEQRIDPATGLLARFDQEDAYTELFLDGTAPLEVAPLPEETLEEEPAEEEPTAPPDRETPEMFEPAPALPEPEPPSPPTTDLAPPAEPERPSSELHDDPPPF